MPFSLSSTAHLLSYPRNVFLCFLTEIRETLAFSKPDPIYSWFILSQLHFSTRPPLLTAHEFDFAQCFACCNTSTSHSLIWGEEHLYPIPAFLCHRSMATEKTKERKTHEPLMTHSWTTHKGGTLHPDNPKKKNWFLGFLRAPLDPLGFTDEFLVGFQINGYHEWFVYQLPICADCLRMSISRSYLWLPLMNNS